MASRAGRVGAVARSRRRFLGADQPRARPRLSRAPRARACERTRVSGASTVSTGARTSPCDAAAGATAHATQDRPQARLRGSGRGDGDRRRAGLHGWRPTAARAETASPCGRRESGGKRSGATAPRQQSFEASRGDDGSEPPGAAREAAQPRPFESASPNQGQARTRGRAERVALTALLPRARRCDCDARRSGDEALPREHHDHVLGESASTQRLMGAHVQSPSWSRLDSCPVRPDGPELVPARHSARGALMRRLRMNRPVDTLESFSETVLSPARPATQGGRRRLRSEQ